MLCVYKWLPCAVTFVIIQSWAVVLQNRVLNHLWLCQTVFCRRKCNFLWTTLIGYIATSKLKCETFMYSAHCILHNSYLERNVDVYWFVSLVRLHCNSRPVNYTFNSLTKYKEAIIRKTVAHAIAICLSKQYFRIISRNDYNQMPALRGMIQRFCTPTSCFSFRARVQGWTISFVFNSVKKRKKKKRKTLTA